MENAFDEQRFQHDPNYQSESLRRVLVEIDAMQRRVGELVELLHRATPQTESAPQP